MADRYFKNDGHSNRPPSTAQEAKADLLQCLVEIVTRYPSDNARLKFDGFYAGPTSVSFLFFALSNIFPDLTVEAKSLRTWSKEFLEFSLARNKRLQEPTPGHCGIANERLTTLALSAILQDKLASVKELGSYAPRLLVSDPPGGCSEWLYGLAGVPVPSSSLPNVCGSIRFRSE
jgi:hypothetical protein